MKKGLSLLIVCMLAFSLAVPAYAADGGEEALTRGAFAAMVNEAYNFYTSDGKLFSAV
mgnify:CR=1 FL=1